MFRHVRRRKILVAALAGAGLAALGVSLGSARATAGAGSKDLLSSNVNTPAGKLEALRAGTSYRAGAFPIDLRLTPPDARWAGAQWTTTSHGKPAFGWAAVGRGSGNGVPLGVIELATAFGPTPPATAILARLRSAGGGATFEKTVRVKLGAFSGWQIDGKVYGRFGHVFVPFSAKTGGASPPDSYRLDPGEVFRLVVLDVRGKRVVVFLDSAALPAPQFPAFLASADSLLQTLAFPG